ncbi:hypothetical protein [Lactococcus lactis]|uniref:hypothetical protein n=1 Tax=Lactococcus lactis TaxID=1358 RepID=UPI0019144F97|nr:hypothetical protein [Lactococcus lactis]WDA67653.1 hypothetical protein IL310_08805 [Lactococcus lactis]
MENKLVLNVKVDNSEELKKIASEIHEHLDCAMKKIEEINKFELQFSVNPLDEQPECNQKRLLG